MRTKFILFIFILSVSFSWGQEKEIKEHFKNVASSDLMILGTFHFANPGLDSYKTTIRYQYLFRQESERAKRVVECDQKIRTNQNWS